MFSTILFITQNGNTALRLASYNGHDEVVNLLLEANAAVDAHKNVMYT